MALSLHAQKKGKRIIDGVLLFAPPLIGFGMQYAITQHLTYGPALSALGYGTFYMLLAWSAVKRFPAAENRLFWRRWHLAAHSPRLLFRWRFQPAGLRWPGRWKGWAYCGLA